MFLTSHSAFIFPIILKKVVPGCQHLGMNSEKNLFSLQQKKLWLFHTYYEASLNKWRENQSEQGGCGKYPAPHLPALLITFLGETHLVTLALQLGKWRLREVKEFSQGHTLGRKGTRDETSVSWTVKLLLSSPICFLPVRVCLSSERLQIIYFNILILQIRRHKGLESNWTCPKSCG